MKKLILAPAVALAFTGLVAAPVAAAEAPSSSTQSDSAAAKAEQVKKDKADKLAKEEAAQKKADEEQAAADKAAEEKAAKDKADQDKKDAADEKSADAKRKAADKADEKSGDDAKDSKKPAPKGDDSKDSKKDDSGTKDDNKSKDSKDSEDPKDNVEKINAQLKVSKSSISAEDLASDGIKVTVTGLEKGDKLTTSSSGLSTPAAIVAADGSKSMTLKYPGDTGKLEQGAVPFAVTVARTGTESEMLRSNINVTAEIDPQISLAADEISAHDFHEKGLEVTGEGFTPEATVELRTRPNGSPGTFLHSKVKANAEGKISRTVKAPDDIREPGAYTLLAIESDNESNSAEAAFTITEDDAVDPIDASLKVDPNKITAEDLSNKDKGVTVTVSGVKKGDKVTDSLTDKTETADADGDYKLHLYYEGNPDSLEEGKVAFTVTIDREGTESVTLDGNINVVAEDKEDGDDGDNAGDTPAAPAEASFTVSPKTLEAADFANDKKGVTLAVEDCEPGSDVHFAVKPKGIQVTAYENTVKADDEGKASVSVFGTSSNASAYVGAYTASATCGDDTMKASFTVTAGADGGGSNGNDNNGSGNDGSQLPRTGADLGGLASGAMLLLVGGAAIAMTGRRKKVGQSPTDF